MKGISLIKAGSLCQEWGPLQTEGLFCSGRHDDSPLGLFSPLESVRQIREGFLWPVYTSPGLAYNTYKYIPPYNVIYKQVDTVYVSWRYLS